MPERENILREREKILQEREPVFAQEFQLLHRQNNTFIFYEDISIVPFGFNFTFTGRNVAKYSSICLWMEFLKLIKNYDTVHLFYFL